MFLFFCRYNSLKSKEIRRGRGASSVKRTSMSFLTSSPWTNNIYLVVLNDPAQDNRSSEKLSPLIYILMCFSEWLIGFGIWEWCLLVHWTSEPAETFMGSWQSLSIWFRVLLSSILNSCLINISMQMRQCDFDF